MSFLLCLIAFYYIYTDTIKHFFGLLIDFLSIKKFHSTLFTRRCLTKFLHSSFIIDIKYCCLLEKKSDVDSKVSVIKLRLFILRYVLMTKCGYLVWVCCTQHYFVTNYNYFFNFCYKYLTIQQILLPSPI